ncbi:transcription-repair coupling factor [Leptolinea tardivitalis]|uniref:transcription-repair coupling factor n=1 Tax=Leptolinea tardivitalis TaxID=229920 RepID=UPI0007811BAD|nr:transcription-repair coupling factor [Leptolinea tardivitalis]GAP20160.1 transcription-repair coupling factor [Leptolinea tardivitalis]
MLDFIRHLPGYAEILASVGPGKTIPGLGLIRSARLPVSCALAIDVATPVLVLTDRSERAFTLGDELKFWYPTANRLAFPAPNPLFYEQASWGNITRRERLQTLASLIPYHMLGSEKPAIPPMIFAPVRAVMARTLPRRDFIKMVKTIKVGAQLSIDDLLRQWVEIGFQSADTVLEVGYFSRRGGILDIWPPAEQYPVRLEFFGDEVDTLRQFDPVSQRTIAKLEKFQITPAREVLPGAASRIGITGEVDEYHLPLVHPAHASLLDYMPRGSLILVDDLMAVQTAANEIEEQAVRLRSEMIKEGVLEEDYPIPYNTWSELQDTLAGQSWLELGRSTSPEIGYFGEVIQPGQRFGGRLKPFNEYIETRLKENSRVMIVSRQASRLCDLWRERQHETGTVQTPEIIDGTLSDGWEMHVDDHAALLLTDSEIFGWERPQARQRHAPSAEAPEAGYADLKAGDWVVHMDYGIGRLVGLVKRNIDDTTGEFLCIEYDNGDQLFVPVHQADRLSRYIGPGGEPPTPTRLGTTEWSTARQHASEAVQQVAHELLELYARRQVSEGYAFHNDTPWQYELEASFPYIETKDQLAAIRSVKKDMEAPRPMDRLLCGDVGYGKTEVALRAAFKAVMDGKQVAVLVPTTVLAQQHYETFRQRLTAFPVKVEMLSRFRSAREQDEIIRKLWRGEIDIIVGTHRLISQDVIFKDLGLAIIDEEQRFGVTHKEHFKKLRTEIDVLTLTATPIPRTLYMALTGVRDISTINTPPEERLPIITHIGPYSPRMVRQAVMRELDREGQIFFVHNRVQTIHAMESHLHQLVPEARVGVAHGQMPEGELARVMDQFSRGEIDILLCTSIIESGLDIPNANTLIVDRGDTFGLAQLYQLRGRVGRGAQRAYAYFFRHRRKPPTPEGQERLEVIAENTQLGAGYSIAMRDLEMRGAGEILGNRQHGVIATVGFHLYTRMLASAVRQLRQSEGMPALEEDQLNMREVQMPVAVDLPLSVGIPLDYVEDQTMRLRLYRRLADVRTEEDIEAMADEFVDRFGPLPDQLKNLLYMLRVKILSETAGLASVTVESDQLVLRFPALPEGTTSRNLPTLPVLRSRAGKNSYWLPMDADEETWKQYLIDALIEVNKLWKTT